VAWFVDGDVEIGSREYAVKMLRSLECCEHMGDVRDVTTAVAEDYGISMEWSNFEYYLVDGEKEDEE
jgi:hypothetical protein